MHIGPAAVQEVLRVQGELERVKQDRDEWKDGCGQYEHCYKYWERVAGARAGLVAELWQGVKGTGGGQDTISAVYYGDAVGGVSCIIGGTRVLGSTVGNGRDRG